MLLLHIIIALAGIVFAAHMCISPSDNKIKVTYGLTGLTVATGTWLVIAHPAHLMQSCLMGLAFLGFTFACIAIGRRKLASVENHIDK
jgi:predicted tellurium resistance membrane protein TerC